MLVLSNDLVVAKGGLLMGLWYVVMALPLLDNVFSVRDTGLVAAKGNVVMGFWCLVTVY